jgi:hypothetical protein
MVLVDVCRSVRRKQENIDPYLVAHNHMLVNHRVQINSRATGCYFCQQIHSDQAAAMAMKGVALRQG